MSKIGLKKSLLITAAILVAVVLVVRDSAPKELPSILKLTPAGLASRAIAGADS